MKLRLLFSVLVMAMFTGCLSEEDILESVLGEAPEVPEGTYFAECNNNGVESTREVLELTENSRSIKLVTYSGLVCGGVGVDGATETAAIEFSDQALGDSISYIEENGDFLPFQYEDGRLVLGFPVSDLSDPSVFQDFIDDPEGSAETIFTLQE